MIVLTQEQWQAITQEEHPRLVHPASQMAYVVVRQDEYERLRASTTTEADAAHVLRIAWMRRMGLDDHEISESIREDPPTNVEEEIKQLRALENLDKIAPAPDELRKYAIKF